LETKLGTIKHDVAKFIGVYNQVFGCRESGTSLDDVLQKALELYKIKHLKQLCFVFIHYWLVLKDVPHWMEIPGEVRHRVASIASPAGGVKARPTAPFPPRQQTATPTTSGLGFGAEELDVGVDEAMQLMAATGGKRGRPVGMKITKEEQCAQKEREHALRAQARVTSKMAAANFQKAQVLHD
jgi:hypothetical protein